MDESTKLCHLLLLLLLAATVSRVRIKQHGVLTICRHLPSPRSTTSSYQNPNNKDLL